MRTTWRVSGPHGERRARSWPAAIDFLLQDVASALKESCCEAYEDMAWGLVSPFAEVREPFTIDVDARLHTVDRVVASTGT